MMTPALKSLSYVFDVDLLIPIKYQDVFLNLPFIKNFFFLENDLPDKKWSRIFDISDYEFNYEHISQPSVDKTKISLFGECLGVKPESNNPIIVLTDEEKNKIAVFFSENNIKSKKTMLFAVRSSNKERDWPMEKWKELIRKLSALNFNLIVVDSELNWEQENVIFFNGHTLREVFSLVWFSDIVVTEDSSLLHIAGAFNKKTIALFGPTDPSMRCVYPNSFSICCKLPCSPCWYDRCKNIHCMKLITVEMAEKKILEVVENAI